MYNVQVLIMCGRVSLQKINSPEHFLHNLQTSVDGRKKKKNQPLCYHMLLAENYLTL